ncbi:hypothetical protein [Rhodococcus aetherivorans]|uniref:hypothetical protein n=1 Tax=Rhodococcus aetherivorans TaxID=191292 RepID=UPI0002D23F5C|nr:hypothetical protein [Rhodococcus aetherivorans]CCW14587.1 hypothetical protein EBESD8_51570 [Rhodococcus aetherivorans]
MPQITGTVRDVAGNLANGTLSVRAKDVRRNAAGDALVDERTHKIKIVNGTITASPVIDPGPVVISLSTPGKYRTWEAVVPTGTSVDLWDVIGQYIPYDPPVVAAAQQAATDAQVAAQRAQDAAADALLIPDGGTDGQALIKAGAGLAWGTATGGGGTTVVEDPPGSGLYTVTSGLTEDPDNPGLYLI